MIHMLNGIPVYADDKIGRDEALQYAAEEQRRWQRRGKALASIDLALDGEDVVITAVEKSPIRRIRRITGYLSTVDRFNDAKQAELRRRLSHI